MTCATPLQRSRGLTTPSGHRLALTAWPPRAQVWVHLASTASILRAGLSALSASAPRGAPPPRILWGQMETYYWDVGVGRPTFHGYGFFKTHDCKARWMRREEMLAISLSNANKTTCLKRRDERGTPRCGGADETTVVGPFSNSRRGFEPSRVTAA